MMITVQGSATQYHQPERANLNIQVRLDGPDKTAVLDQVAVSANQIQELIAPLANPAAGRTAGITWFSADQIRVDAQRPWNNDGAQLPLVYTAAVEFKIRFADFNALNSFYLEAATISGVVIDGVTWELTEPARLAATQLVQGLAVRNAQTKALTYARALQELSVRCVALADPGMLGNSESGVGHPMAFADASVRSVKMGGSPELTLKPQDIEITCRVDAKFETVAPARQA